MSAPTNLVMTDLEDAIVEKLLTNATLQNRVFAAATPLIDISQYPNLPLVFLSVTSERESNESQSLGQKLRRKVEPVIEIVICATAIRARGDLPGLHEIAATIKDTLMGWTPDLAGVHRPLVYEDGNQFDHDEETKIIAWLQSWSTMTIVKEV